MKKLPKCPLTMSSADNRGSTAPWGMLCDQLTEEEKTRGHFLMALHICRHHPEEDSCSTAAAFQDNPERHDTGEGKSSRVERGRTSDSIHGHPFCLAGEIAMCVIVSQLLLDL